MIKRIVELFIGLMLFSLGNAFVLHGNIGLDSWNSFHSGISIMSGIPIGYVSMIVSVFVLFISIKLGEKIGLGTIADSIFVGLFFQIFIDLGFLNIQTSILSSLLYVFIGIEIISIGVILYMSSGLGMGPRDSMYVALAKKFNTKVGYTKVVVEVLVVVTAFFIGGQIGLGTLITAVFAGLVLQLNIYLFKFDPKDVEHENVIQTMKSIVRK